MAPFCSPPRSACASTHPRSKRSSPPRPSLLHLDSNQADELRVFSKDVAQAQNLVKRALHAKDKDMIHVALAAGRRFECLRRSTAWAQLKLIEAASPGPGQYQVQVGQTGTSDDGGTIPTLSACFRSRSRAKLQQADDRQRQANTALSEVYDVFEPASPATVPAHT
eukprot:COSAG05_NODE_2865_length_2555_cov_28.306471_2_plen_166_part_00